jgi:hypothetical protein
MKDYKKYLVKGELAQGKGNAINMESYEASFILPDMEEGEARSIIHRKLIHGHLKDTVEYYKRWRTCQIINIVKPSAEELKEVELDVKDIDVMGISQLCRLALNYNLKLDPSKMTGITEARRKVLNEIESKEQAPIKDEEPEAKDKKPSTSQEFDDKL